MIKFTHSGRISLVSTALLILYTLSPYAVAQSAEDSWVMLAAPAPYRAQVSYIQAGGSAYSFTCKEGDRGVQHWFDGNISDKQVRIQLVGPNGKITFSSIHDHSMNPNISFRMFRADDTVELVSNAVDIPRFQWSEFMTAYRAFHKSCHRGFSTGSIPTYNCGVFQNREARAACGSANLGRMQRTTVERYEQVSRGLASVDEKVEAWRRYSAHMDEVATCSNDRTGDCYTAAYQTFLAELEEFGAGSTGTLPGLEASLPDSELQAEMSRHGFSSARGMGRIDELHFVDATIGATTFFVVLHDVPVNSDVDPVDERLLLAASLLAHELTPPAQVSLYHIVKNHPVPMDAAGRANEPGITQSKLTISWDGKNSDTLVARFAHAFEPTSAQAVLGTARDRAAAAQSYSEHVEAGLARMDQERRASALARERDKARLAARAGLVYRNPEFWSSVGGSDARRIFEGEQVPPIVGVRYFTGWLAASAAYCSPFEDGAREIEWPDGPALRQILADDAQAGAFPEQPRLLVKNAYIDLFSAVAQPALLSSKIVSRSRQSAAITERMAGPERDAARLLRMAGCSSTTSRQFEMNLVQLLRGNASLQAAGERLEHAEKESDAPPD
ncbi:hypothetical protein [Kineobactrum salinum]|uniref:Uncharacterized protein n=1 Tax=Kineobactrum salinum TaxID=2708301 RepID=A0A6C0TZZ0_9GAMM|nr:hypothetical protein [Kineobactrum salinum]QIB65410.1 hypothetical protein G3T16_08360 [Kineobactrum salinum]